jgi:hypothetical protein
MHAVAEPLANGGHSLLSMGKLRPADIIPCLSHELSQLKLNLLLSPCQLQLSHRINKNSKALNTALLLFYLPRIQRHSWLIEYPAQSTQVRTFLYCRLCNWSVMSIFSFRLASDSSRGPTCYPTNPSCAVPSHAL